MSRADIERAVLASGNAGKLEEMRALLVDLGIEVVAQAEFGLESPEETGTTFVENALLKARYAAGATELPAIADDSGLVVAALGGRPGIYSARYAGEDATDEENVDKLLDELAGHEDRSAYFHCALAFVRDGADAQPLIAEASWHGSIGHERRGSGGFGYDPVFYVPEHRCHSAELSAATKNRLSHRGQALARLVELLRAAYPAGRDEPGGR